MDITSILEKVDSEMFGIWFLIGAALVFLIIRNTIVIVTIVQAATQTRPKSCLPRSEKPPP